MKIPFNDAVILQDVIRFKRKQLEDEITNVQEQIAKINSDDVKSEKCKNLKIVLNNMQEVYYALGRIMTTLRCIRV